MEIESEGGQGTLPSQSPGFAGFSEGFLPSEIFSRCGKYHPGISRVELHTRFVNQSPGELRKNM